MSIPTSFVKWMEEQKVGFILFFDSEGDEVIGPGDWRISGSRFVYLPVDGRAHTFAIDSVTKNGEDWIIKTGVLEFKVSYPWLPEHFSALEGWAKSRNVVVDSALEALIG